MLLGTSFQNDRDRIYMWEAAWLGIQANPVLGVGIGNDRSDYEHWRTVVADRYGGHRYLNPPEVGVHNVYLQVAYELGALGLITYLAFLGSWVLWCVQHLRGRARRPGVSRGILWGVLAALAGIGAAAGLGIAPAVAAAKRRLPWRNWSGSQQCLPEASQLPDSSPR